MVDGERRTPSAMVMAVAARQGVMIRLTATKYKKCAVLRYVFIRVVVCSLFTYY